MAIKVNFFDNTTHDYFADDLNKQFKSIVNINGVSGKSSFSVTATSPESLDINVSSGYAWIDGHFINSDSTAQITIPLNSSSTTIVHHIIVRLITSSKSASIIRVTADQLPVDGQYVTLATITMANNNTNVTTSQITDKRTFIEFADNELVSSLRTELEKIKKGDLGIGHASSADYATNAGHATNCDNATRATTASSATQATNASKLNNKQESDLSVGYATSAATADTVDGYHVWTGSQSSYNAISSKNSKTLYFIY